MKEIKFRVWDKKNEIMYYGYEPNRPNMITFDGEICAQTLKGMDMYGNPLAKMDYYPQERFILMQYTGLKDVDGKEIYEGDIVLYEVKYIGQQKFEVIWMQDGYCLRELEHKYIRDGIWWENTEKIGNIYQNPELLEEE